MPSEVVDPKISTVRADLFRRYREVDGLSERLRRLPSTRGGVRIPVTKGKESDALVCHINVNREAGPFVPHPCLSAVERIVSPRGAPAEAAPAHRVRLRGSFEGAENADCSESGHALITG